jgi:hypothetical protein
VCKLLATPLECLTGTSDELVLPGEDGHQQQAAGQEVLKQHIEQQLLARNLL